MSLFDSLKDPAGRLIEGGAHDTLHGVLDASPLGGLSGLLDKLHAGGLGEAVEAWTLGGEHPPVSAEQVHAALGEEHVQHLAGELGVSPDALTAGLAEHLPALAAAHEGLDDEEFEPEAEHDEDADHEDVASEAAAADDADDAEDDDAEHEAESADA